MLALLISIVAASAISAAVLLTRIRQPAAPLTQVSDDFEERLRIRRDTHRQRQFTR